MTTRATRSKTKGQLTDSVGVSESKKCQALDERYKFCSPSSEVTVLPKGILTMSALYREFYLNLKRGAVRYRGKKVLITQSDQNVDYICPSHKIRIGDSWYTISATETGYIYLHLLKNLVPNTGDCVYAGDHITIAPTGRHHIHFHVTHLHLEMRERVVEVAMSHNWGFCTLPLHSVKGVYMDSTKTPKDKMEWLQEQTCLNKELASYNTNVGETVIETDLLGLISAIFSKGFSAPIVDNGTARRSLPASKRAS